MQYVLKLKCTTCNVDYRFYAVREEAVRTMVTRILLLTSRQYNRWLMVGVFCDKAKNNKVLRRIKRGSTISVAQGG